MDAVHLMTIVEAIGVQNPLQKKRIKKFLNTQSHEYWAFAENLSHLLRTHFLVNDKELYQGAKYYNLMCTDFLREQILFQKTGKYRVATAEEAQKSVYNNKEVMLYYMVGLLISYMFWPNHYKLHQFYLKHLPNYTIKDYLEIGVGHGLFTYEVLKKAPHLKPTVVDISETSIAVAKVLFQALEIESHQVEFCHGDFLKTSLPLEHFDFIVMGEVLEHVDDAIGFMKRAYELLKPGGAVFMTTCANAPAIDHVYHFRNVQEIRDVVMEAGFVIIDDVAFPAEDIPVDQWEESLVTINYGSYLQKKS